MNAFAAVFGFALLVVGFLQGPIGAGLEVAGSIVIGSAVIAEALRRPRSLE